LQGSIGNQFLLAVRQPARIRWARTTRSTDVIVINIKLAIYKNLVAGKQIGVEGNIR
jgi:hypothetical protein